MKVVLLAGGFGTRISEESYMKPKPMIEIAEMPILWHIMKVFSYYGHNDFIICCGYKQHMIKKWFADYYLHNSDVTFDFTSDNQMHVHNNKVEPWKVTLVDTGLNTMTGGRIKRVQKYIGNEPFLLTYGDGVSDVNIDKLIEFHQKEGKMVTLTAVKPAGRFGVLELTGNKVESFREKKQNDMGWINAGFMVIEPEVFEHIEGDTTVFEQEPLEKIASLGQLNAFRHRGFWQCMDTIKDKQKLEELWKNNNAPWKNW